MFQWHVWTTVGTVLTNFTDNNNNNFSSYPVILVDSDTLQWKPFVRDEWKSLKTHLVPEKREWDDHCQQMTGT